MITVIADGETRAMNRNEIVLGYLLKAKKYLQDYTSQIVAARNDQTPSRFYNLFSASVFHQTYSKCLVSAKNGGAPPAETQEKIELDLANAKQNVEYAKVGLGGIPLAEALSAYQEYLELAFGVTFDDSSAAGYPVDDDLALDRYSKAFEDVARWLEKTYCDGNPTCNLNRYQTFRDVIGDFTLVRTSDPIALLAQIVAPSPFPPQIACNGNNCLFFPVRGLTTDHVTYEIYGPSRYIGPPFGTPNPTYRTTSQAEICSLFPAECTQGVPNNSTYTLGSYQNAMEPGNFVHELAHIFINSSGFRAFGTSPLFKADLITQMTIIMNARGTDRYNDSGTENEELANFIGALMVGDRPNSPLNDGIAALTAAELSVLDGAVSSLGTTFKALLQQSMIINVLRNTSPQEIAQLMGSGNVPLSGSGQELRYGPSTEATSLPRPASGNMTVLAKTTANDWIYIGVPRQDRSSSWYDYGWINEGIADSLPEFTFEGVSPYSLQPTTNGGLGLSFTAP